MGNISSTCIHTYQAATEFNLPILAILVGVLQSSSEKSTAEACQVPNLMGCTRELQDFLDCFRRTVWNMAIELGFETPTKVKTLETLSKTQRTQQLFGWKRCKDSTRFGWIFVDF